MKNGVSRRERERKELRFRILETARLLFAQGGEAAVSLRRVAEIIEFSATTIYQHFPNKEALVQEVCALEFALFSRALQQAESVPDAMERLRKVASLYVDFGLQHPEHYRVLFMRERASEAERPAPSSAVAMPPASAAGAAATGTAATAGKELPPYDYLHRAVFKAMAVGCFKAEYRDVVLLAQSIWSCLHGVVALHLVRAQHAAVPWKPVQSILEMSVEALCNGLTVPACQVPPTWRR